MNETGSLSWFAAHELRLAWRDWMSMMTAGKAVRERAAQAAVAAFAVLLHLLAYAVLREPLAESAGASREVLTILTSMIVLATFMMISQALEHVTRAFYGRSDMELILSSPSRSQPVFAVRIVAVAMTTSAMATLLAAPFINIAIMLDGPRWCAAYIVIAAAAALATAVSVLITIGLFSTIGPRRTRIAAQIIAAVIGAGFLISAQVIAILAHGSMSRFQLFADADFVRALPDGTSVLWLPARAAMGEGVPLVIVLAAGLAALTLAVMSCAGRFAGHVIAAAGVSESHVRQSNAKCKVGHVSSQRALRDKEWRLLARDPWLISQTLMQILYLLPPAVMLWRNYGDSAGAFVVLAPVLVMALGQLAGGLAWLAISGEDAPDLLASAPISPRAATTAKIEAVLAIVAVAAAPFVAVMAFSSIETSMIVLAGCLVAAASAVAIQLWFRTPATRSHFRRRQTASKASTFCEAFSSIMWAGATGLAIAHSWFCLLFALLAVSILVLAWAISPSRPA